MKNLDMEIERLERLAADLDRKMQRAREAHDADPSAETQRVAAELRAEERRVAARILDLQYQRESARRKAGQE